MLGVIPRDSTLHAMLPDKALSARWLQYRPVPFLDLKEEWIIVFHAPIPRIRLWLCPSLAVNFCAFHWRL